MSRGMLFLVVLVELLLTEATEASRVPILGDHELKGPRAPATSMLRLTPRFIVPWDSSRLPLPLDGVQFLASEQRLAPDIVRNPPDGGYERIIQTAS